MNLLECVQRFDQQRVLVLGDVMLDSYLEGVASRICNEAPVPVVRKSADERAAGGAANTAVNLRALGADVDLLGITGSDQAGQLLRETLQQRNVSDQWLVADPNASTHHKMRVMANGQYLVRFDDGRTDDCHPETTRQLLRELTERFGYCDAVVVSDYAYGTVSDEVLEQLRELRRHRSVPLIVDSKALLRYRDSDVTVVTPNLHEAQAIVQPGIPFEGPIDLPKTESTARQLRAILGAKAAAITLGADGAFIVDELDEARHVPSRASQCRSDIGAGDAFTAALSLAISVGAGMHDATRLGVEAATIAVSNPRTAIAHYREIAQRVSLISQGFSTSDSLAVARELAAELDRQRLAGKSVVFTNGYFDMLHAGHIRFLQEAKTFGDILVVGVNSDASARRLSAGRHPLNSEQDRLALAEALDAVDHALLFDEDTPADLIRIVRPDIHVKGGDYAGVELPEADAVREVGGRVVIRPLIGMTQQIPERDAEMVAADGWIGGEL